jgi:hypothetical protein
MDILPSRFFLVISCFLIMGIPEYENLSSKYTYTIKSFMLKLAMHACKTKPNFRIQL